MIQKKGLPNLLATKITAHGHGGGGVYTALSAIKGTSYIAQTNRGGTKDM